MRSVESGAAVVVYVVGDQCKAMILSCHSSTEYELLMCRDISLAFASESSHQQLFIK